MNDVEDKCSILGIEYPSFDTIYEIVYNETRVKQIREYDIFWMSKNVETREQARNAAKEYFRSWYDEARDAIEGVCAGKKIYRSIQIRDIDTFIDEMLTKGKTTHEAKKKLSCIGTSWSWDRESAYAYKGYLGKDVKDYIFEAIVPDPKSIYVKATLQRPFQYGKEHEIVLDDDSYVIITAIYKRRGGKNLLIDRGIESIRVCV